ncbi:hypothetical protein YQE_11261, partial [Dendroctonus ponderosae]
MCRCSTPGGVSSRSSANTGAARASSTAWRAWPSTASAIGWHLCGQVRHDGEPGGAAGTPPLHRRLQHEPRDRLRLEQPPPAGVRRERKGAEQLRQRGLGGGGVQVPEGRGRGRPGLHMCGRFGKQPHPDLPSGWDVPALAGLLGRAEGRVQGAGGRGHDPRRAHFGLRPGESSHP